MNEASRVGALNKTDDATRPLKRLMQVPLLGARGIQIGPKARV